MHDYRKCKVSVNGRIGRTARLSECLRSYVTSNPASPATRRVATPTTSPTWPRSRRPCAMRERTTWSFSTPDVLERLLAVGSFGEQHPHADLLDSTGSLWAQLDDSRPWEYFSKVQACQEGFARIAGVLRLAG